MVATTFKDLIVWQKSIVLVRQVYELCEELPDKEKFGLSSQMRRAAVSVPSNIAEGYRRRNRKEYLQFLGIASGSAAELETQLIITNDIFNLEVSVSINLLLEIQKMLTTMQRNLELPPKP